MKMIQLLRHAASVVSGGALLLTLAGSASAQSGLAGSGTLSGATITQSFMNNGTETCFTLTLVSATAGNGGTGPGNFLNDTATGKSYEFTAVDGFYLTPATTAYPITPVSGPTGFIPNTLVQPPASGLSGNLNGNGFGSNTNYLLAPGATQPNVGTSDGNNGTFCFLTSSLPMNYNIVLDVFAPGKLPNNSQTGRIEINGLPFGVPEPGAYAAFLVGGVGVLALMARARRRGVRPTAT